ncbi:MAG: hypothetical protein GAK32_01140 [Pseudomonas fluorescens]|nr:MAG: hypothetical protein GAK32_01140 [Pseudomonas fluorescens]
MALTTQILPFAGSSSLYNTGNPDHRVPIYKVLTHEAIASVSTRHHDSVKKVSRQEMDALLVANQAIDDTWQILNRGSANQQRHLLSTEADSFKRTMLLRAENTQMGHGQSDSARTAARFAAGNCGEMAAVCALLATSTGINQPVSVLSSNMHDHAVAEIGDPRMTEKTIIVDAWPEFGRAIRRKDFTLLGDNPTIQHTYAPQPAQPQERTRLLYDNKVSQKQIDADFAKLYPNRPKNGKKLLQELQLTSPGYAQQHGAKNLKVRYRGDDSQGIFHQVDPNLTEAQFKQRLIQLGLDPKTGKPTPGNRRPQSTPMDAMKRAIGKVRARTASMSAATSPPITVPWTAPPRPMADGPRWGAEPPRPFIPPMAAELPRPVIPPMTVEFPRPVIPPMAMEFPRPVIPPMTMEFPRPVIPPRTTEYVRPRYTSMSAADGSRRPAQPRMPAPPVEPRGRTAATDMRMPREERRRTSSTAPLPRPSTANAARGTTRPAAEASTSRTARHASREGHRLATATRIEHADSFILTMRRLPTRDDRY